MPGPVKINPTVEICRYMAEYSARRRARRRAAPVGAVRAASSPAPMTYVRRLAVYGAEGPSDLTPRQYRRMLHKQNRHTPAPTQLQKGGRHRATE